MQADNRDMHGSIEFLNGARSGECRAWKAGMPGGYVSKNGGFTQKLSNAVVYRGPGDAIYAARMAGFAVMSW